MGFAKPGDDDEGMAVREPGGRRGAAMAELPARPWRRPDRVQISAASLNFPIC
jgi:hypothetical protein